VSAVFSAAGVPGQVSVRARAALTAAWRRGRGASRP